ncbi:MAG: hypothetical protein S0880_13115 [Actinomycetota bacterium]|nr:hypothetical protein [Actinomycetota bacterium]
MAWKLIERPAPDGMAEVRWVSDEEYDGRGATLRDEGWRVLDRVAVLPDMDGRDVPLGETADLVDDAAVTLPDVDGMTVAEVVAWVDEHGFAAAVAAAEQARHHPRVTLLAQLEDRMP